MKLSALILAAGLGSRLRPLTDTCPKPLIKVGGHTMLHRAIRHTTQAGATSTVVNIHHLAPIMRQAISVHHPSVIISDESDLLLDTGGGIAQACRLLPPDTDHMLVYNADILTDIDLRQMVKAHQTSKADVTLLVSASRNSSRKLLFDNDGHMCGWTNTTTGEVRPASAAPINAMAFGGIHLLSAHALRALCAYSDSRNGVFPVMDFYIDNCQALHINAWEPEAGSIWIDIGRPETLAQAQAIFPSPNNSTPSNSTPNINGKGNDHTKRHAI